MNTITRQDAQDLADILDAELRDDYSGRSMFGAQCFGFVIDSGPAPLVALGFAIGEVFSDDPEDYDRLAAGRHLARSACIDSMGLGTIVYFPRYTLTDEED